MSDSNKLWVIDLGEEFTVQEPEKKPVETRRNPPKAVLPIKQVVPKAATPAPARPSRRLHYATAVVLTYLLGPFALLLWPKGRKSPLWAAIAILSGLSCIALAWQWRAILVLGNGASLLIPALVAAGVVSLLAFTSWAMALHQAFISRTRSHSTFPGWMRSAWAVTGLGLLAPGLGLFLTGSRKRAVAALWLLWPTFGAAVILAHAGWTWRWLQSSIHHPRIEVIFENLMMALAAVLMLGTLGWLVQALVGLHQRSRRQGRHSSAHGDRYAAALLVAVVALAVLAQPADIASLISDASGQLHDQGFQVIPLQLARSAQKLDPSEATYDLQVAALHQEQGHVEEAAKVQRALDRDLQVYYGMLVRQNSEPAAPEVPQSDPEADSVPESGQRAAPPILNSQLEATLTEDGPGPL